MNPPRNELERIVNLTRFEKALDNTARVVVRVAYFKRYVRIGRAHKYPLCCVLQFAWETSNTRLRPRRLRCGVQRGGIYINGVDHDVYVPCKFHMKRSPHWRSHNEHPPRQLRIFTMEPK